MEVKKNPNVDISKDRSIYRAVSFAFVFAITILMFSFTTFEKKKAQQKKAKGSTVAETVVNTVQQKAVAPPPPAATTIIDLVDNTQEETNLEDIDFEVPEIPTTDINLNQNTGGVEIEKEFFDPSEVEEQATWITGNEEDFYTMLSENLDYPDGPESEGIEDVIWVTFFIDKDGTVSGVKTDGKGDLELQAEAMRIIKLTSGQWKPALYKKKPVKTICKIPIQFELNQ
ncbi:MAG TPA: energy transducer TonB [Bacteroidia bacterium]